MPVSNYTTKTTGKVRKLVDFECPMCGNKEEHWEDEKPKCEECREVEHTCRGVNYYWRWPMTKIHSPKNNAQRSYVRDERRD